MRAVRRCCALLLLVFTSFGYGEQSQQECVRNAVYSLEKAGETTRSFLFFTIYELALYLPTSSAEKEAANEGAGFAAAVLSPRVAKQLQLRYTRDLSAERVRKVLRKGFRENATPQAWRNQEARLNALLASIHHDIEAGDALWLDWQPGCGLSLIYNGEMLLSESDAEFSRILFSIWLGDHSVVDRAALMGAN